MEATKEIKKQSKANTEEKKEPNLLSGVKHSLTLENTNMPSLSPFKINESSHPPLRSQFNNQINTDTILERMQDLFSKRQYYELVRFFESNLSRYKERNMSNSSDQVVPFSHLSLVTYSFFKIVRHFAF